MKNLLKQIWDTFKQYPFLFTWRFLVAIIPWFLWTVSYLYIEKVDGKVGWVLDKIAPAPWSED